MAQPHQKYAAILQLEGVHEEVILSVVNALAQNGYKSKIYMNEVIFQNRQDIFQYIPNFDAEYHYVPIKTVEDWDNLRAKVKDDPEVEMVFFNTFQRQGGANLAKQIGKPALGIVHNPSFFDQTIPWVKDMDMSQVSLLTLAKHATSEMVKINPARYADTGTMAPFYWGFPTDIMSLTDFFKSRRIVVPGSVNFANRDYPAILEAIRELVSAGTPQNGVISIIGGGPQRAKFEAQVKAEGLEAWFDFAELDKASGFVTHENYFRELARASFVLPILPLSKADYRTYKISASISTAAGYALPPILDHWTATAYDIPGIAYDGGDLAKGLQTAMTTTAQDYVAMRGELLDFKNRALQKNASEIARLLARIST